MCYWACFGLSGIDMFLCVCLSGVVRGFGLGWGCVVCLFGGVVRVLGCRLCSLFCFGCLINGVSVAVCMLVFWYLCIWRVCFGLNCFCCFPLRVVYFFSSLGLLAFRVCRLVLWSSVIGLCVYLIVLGLLGSLVFWCLVFGVLVVGVMCLWRLCWLLVVDIWFWVLVFGVWVFD